MRLAAGVEVKGARHLFVFALAPIPILVLFGAVLGNKVAADVYQRHRDTENWRWKSDGEPVDYTFRTVTTGSVGGPVALALSLSGKVSTHQVESSMGSGTTVYEITLKDQEPRPTYLRLRDDLARFAVGYREALASIRASHPGLSHLGIFPAVPAPVAVTVGRGNGFGELTDPVEQRKRFELELERRRRSGAPHQPIDEPFLAALEEGMPPSGGNALGFDRLVALATSTARIAGVVAFPGGGVRSAPQRRQEVFDGDPRRTHELP